MRSRKLGITTLAAFTLFSGVALAGKIQQEGSIVGDPLALVELKVVEKGGEAVAVKGIHFKDLLADCKEVDTRVKLRPQGAVSLNEAGRFNRVYDAGGGGELTLRGGIKDHGEKASGHIESNYFPFAGDECRVNDSKFKTST